MTTTDHRDVPYTSELQVLNHAAEALEEVHRRIGPRFRRAETRRRVRRFLEGLLAPVERKNGWQLVEALGEQGPHGVQRLLYEADWDEEAVRDELRSYVLKHLGEEAGTLVVDETGFLKKGKQPAGVARQYSGTAGGRANCQIGVFLLYAGSKGAAFIDRELYLPEEWTVDRVRCREAGIPDSVRFATKGELAKRMLTRAFAAGGRAAWVVGDTIYGSDELRTWLERQQQPYVLAVAETHPVWSEGRAQPVGLVASLLPEEAWTPLSAGEGSQGPRLYHWAWLEVNAEPEARCGWRSWILIRRSLSDPGKRAYYRVWGGPQITLAALGQVARRHWTIEEGIEEAKGEVGLDHYEVRTWRGWYRHSTLALFAHAMLVILRAQAAGQTKKGRCRHRRPAECGGTAPPVAGAAGVRGATREAAVVVALSPTASGRGPTRPYRPPCPAGSTCPPAWATTPGGAEPARIDACSVGPHLSAPAAVPAGASGEELPPDGGGHRVGHADGRLLEIPARTLWPLADSRGCYQRWRQAGVWEQVRQVLVAPDVACSSSA